MNTKIGNIISVYSNLWVDVLYNRKLKIHLQKVENDIDFIVMLTMLAYFRNDDPNALLKIKQELVWMCEIIKKRMANSHE